MSKENTPPTVQSVSQTLKEWNISSGFLAAQGPHGRFAHKMMKVGVYSYLKTAVQVLGLEPVQDLLAEIVPFKNGDEMRERLVRWDTWRRHQDVTDEP